MKIQYLGIVRNDLGEDKSVELAYQTDLSHLNWAARSTAATYMSFFAKQFAERTKPGQRFNVQKENTVIHCYGRSEGICGVLVSDEDYNELAAQQVLSKIVDEFLASVPKSAWSNMNPKASFPELKDYIVKYQDARNVSNLTQIQSQLDETKEVLHKTIESVLQRGESLDSLVDKSNQLSTVSKDFYKTAASQNKCCVLM